MTEHRKTQSRAALAPIAALYALVTAVIVSALLVSIYAFLETRWNSYIVLSTAVITIIAVGYDLTVARVEKIRRSMVHGPYLMMSSAWTFGSALALPLPSAVVVTCAVYMNDELQRRRDGVRRPLYRVAFNGGSVALSCAIAHLIFLSVSKNALSGQGNSFWLRPLVAFCLALVAYTVLNAALVGCAIALSTRDYSRSAFIPRTSESLLELATLGLGVFVTVAINVNIWLLLFVLPATLFLQRSALVEQLESAASEDSKTGLLNSAAWEHLAGRDLAGSMARKQPVSLLAIDLDNFKRVNDQYGHLSGDEVLKAVATCMKTMLRDRDLISRFGGEEFMALLPGADSKEAMIVAERLRTRVENLRVAQVGTAHQAAVVDKERVDGQQPTRSTEMRITVSVGVASYPSHGHALAELMEKADAALYQAKHDGRNRVQLSPKLVETEAEQLQVTVNETDPNPIR